MKQRGVQVTELPLLSFQLLDSNVSQAQKPRVTYDDGPVAIYVGHQHPMDIAVL